MILNSSVAQVHMTFQLPGGVSASAERMLWRRGILTWQDFISAPTKPFSPRRSRSLLQAIGIAQSRSDPPKILSLLALDSPAWRLRLYPFLAPQAAFLDIETTGLGPAHHPTTAAVWYRGCLRLFVEGVNMADLPRSIPKNCVLVTYYGRRFDLPRLRRHLGMQFPQPHLDLGPLLRRLGYGPGLKNALSQLRVPRPRDLPQGGREAVGLWELYQKGDLEALRQLLVYNAYDAALLHPLWVKACNRSLQAWPLFRPFQPSEPPAITALVDDFLVARFG